MPDNGPAGADGAAVNLRTQRLQAVMAAARHFGVDLDPSAGVPVGPASPTAAELASWATEAGLWASAVRIGWSRLVGIADSGPAVLMLRDGGALILAGAIPGREVVLVRNPGQGMDSEAVPVDRARLEKAWNGEALLMRASRSASGAEAPFTVRWLAELVLRERKPLRDIGIASVTLSFLTIFPPLLVMTVVDKVLAHDSRSTLALLSVILGIAVVYETLLGFARRQIVLVTGTRIDARLNIHIFSRLLRLPIDYFEKHPSGETMHKIAQIYKVRDFITGKLLTTFLDLITLAVLLPFLFYLNAALSWLVVACSVAILGIIAAFLRPLRLRYKKVVVAETDKASTLGETIYGVRTVKSLALEPQRKQVWDGRVADAGHARLAFGMLSNIPQTIVNPIERFMSTGVILVGALMALSDHNGYAVGALFAFMMLSMRVAQPLVGVARLLEDIEEISGAVSEVAYVLNRPLEADASSGGLRPVFEGGITFDNVTYNYPGSRLPALKGVSFSVPAGTTLGVVGRSGSGKSTITRLLQGIGADYDGSIKIDGTDLREINLRHLRCGFGVVLQDNFLFRETIKDNILAGRPGLTLQKAVDAARLAGAEEFIERLPNGYQTWIQEGSPNLSGGQKQRLAIARALVCDPRILILDEATSALDPESEALVNANLERIAKGRTMVVVSHRLSSLTRCDQIVVLDRGELLDCAPHRVLLERCDVYRLLWAQQNRHLENPENAIAGARHVR